MGRTSAFLSSSATAATLDASTGRATLLKSFWWSTAKAGCNQGRLPCRVPSSVDAVYHPAAFNLPPERLARVQRWHLYLKHETYGVFFENWELSDVHPGALIEVSLIGMGGPSAQLGRRGTWLPCGAWCRPSYRRWYTMAAGPALLLDLGCNVSNALFISVPLPRTPLCRSGRETRCDARQMTRPNPSPTRSR